MARYRQIHCSFWNDDTDISDNFSPEDRYFYLYLLTNPHTKQCGIYEISIRYMMIETGYNTETIEKLLDRFENTYKKIKYNRETKELAIKNWLRYNDIKSENVQKCIAKELKLVKDLSLIDFLTINPLQAVSKEEENKNKKKNIYVKQAGVVLKYLNNKANRNYKALNKYTIARVKEYGEKKCKLVVDFKVDEWLNDEKMNKYLRQETLFAPSHFDTYLENAERWAKVNIKEYPKCHKCGKDLRAEIEAGKDWCFDCGTTIKNKDSP